MARGVISLRTWGLRIPSRLKHCAADDKITAAAVVQQSFEEHNAQLYLASALLCKGSAMATVKHTEVNNGLEAWRGLNAQPKRAESILQTSEAVERWECDVREYEQRSGKTLDEDVTIGVILALAPLQVQNHCHLNSHILKRHAQVRTMLFDCCRAQADAAAGDAEPMDLSMLGKGGKGKRSQGDKKGKGKGNGKKGESNKDEKDKDKNKKGKGKGKNNAKADYFVDTVFNAKVGGTSRRIAGGTRMLRAERTLHLWRLRLRKLRAQRRNHRSLEC